VEDFCTNRGHAYQLGGLLMLKGYMLYRIGLLFVSDHRGCAYFFRGVCRNQAPDDLKSLYLRKGCSISSL
ncbi:hypothetical protein SESBI_40010, partial [Sesbania bispinosa]